MVLLKETFVSLLHQRFVKNFSPHWNEKIGGKGNMRKEKSEEKGEKSLSICICLSKKALSH